MKIYKTLRGQTDLLTVDTNKNDGVLTIEILEGIENPATVRSMSFPVPPDIARLVVRALFDGMRIEDPDGDLPIYKVDPT